MNKRSICILVIIASVLAGFVYSWYYKDNVAQNVKMGDAQPTYIGTNISTVYFNQDGSQRYLFTADQVAYFVNKKESAYTKPKLVILPEVLTNKENNQNTDIKDTWVITAGAAKLDSANTLFLHDPVHIANTTSLVNNRLEFKLGDSTINLNNKDISSTAPVWIKGAEFNATGIGLTGNLQQQNATILKQAKTIYYEDKY